MQQRCGAIYKRELLQGRREEATTLPPALRSQTSLATCRDLRPEAVFLVVADAFLALAGLCLSLFFVRPGGRPRRPSTAWRAPWGRTRWAPRWASSGGRFSSRSPRPPTPWWDPRPPSVRAPSRAATSAQGWRRTASSWSTWMWWAVGPRWGHGWNRSGLGRFETAQLDRAGFPQLHAKHSLLRAQLHPQQYPRSLPLYLPMLSRAAHSASRLRPRARHAPPPAAPALPGRRLLSLNPLPNQAPNITNDMPGEEETRSKEGPKRSSAAFDSALGTLAGELRAVRAGSVEALTGGCSGLGAQGWGWWRSVELGITTGTSSTSWPR